MTIRKTSNRAPTQGLTGWKLPRIARVAAVTDPSFASVQWLMNFEGNNGDTTFTDVSSIGRVVTTVGDAKLTTSNPPPGCSTSLLLDGTGDRITVPNATTGLNFDGDFTIDGWLRPSGAARICAATTSSGSNVQIARVETSNAIFNNAGGSNATSSTGIVTRDAWFFYAFVRSGSTIKTYIGGTEVTSYTGASAFRADVIGAGNALGDQWNGQVGPFRFTKGVVRYTATFTPPEGPFPAQ